jgi:hypothetical protein
MDSFFTPRGRIGLIASSLILCSCTGDDVALATDTVAPPPPVVNLALNRTYPTNNGLVPTAGEYGWPITEGETMDPAIVESRRFYDVLAQLSTSGQPVPTAPAADAWNGLSTAPMTLEDWKNTFRFPARAPGESLEAYRDRAGIIIYYNQNELGLGRELGCSEFPDGRDAAGNPLTGIACYVTNYGLAFRDVRNSLHLAQEGDHPKNTVCIAYLPSAEPDYQIQFFVYGPSGRRQDWAQLDTLGPRANPHVCMNCHGGVYDEKRHLAKFARFLPMDPNVVLFGDGQDGTFAITRAAQEERIRRANALAYRSPLTPGQREMLNELYAGQIETPGTVSLNTWQPPGWRGTPQHRDLFDKVVKPYCITCHLATQRGLDGGAVFSYGIFESAERFRAFPSHVVMCGDFTMPNAQTTLVNFWNTNLGPITIGDAAYPAPADALLAFFGRTRANCANIAEVSTCNRGPDPDLNCGNAFSGTACVRSTGRCVPSRGVGALTDGSAPVGFCRTDGSRRCQYPLKCQKSAEVIPGLESFDGVCLRESY